MTPTEQLDYLARWSRDHLTEQPWPLMAPLPPQIRTAVDIWATLLTWHQSGRSIIPVEDGSRSPALVPVLALGTIPIPQAGTAYTVGNCTIAVARIPQGAEIPINGDRTLCISQRGAVLTYVATDGRDVDVGYISLADQPTPANLRLLPGYTVGEIYTAPNSEEHVASVGVLLARVLPRFYSPS